MRDGVFVEGLFVGATTLAIGSALMLVPSKSKAWPFVGTFLRTRGTRRRRWLIPLPRGQKSKLSMGMHS